MVAPRTRRILLRARAAVLALVALSGCSYSEEDEGTRPAPAESSVLAVGDTGEPWGPLPGLFEAQLAVGRAMEQVHAAAPVDALILLGDNFYPDGLRAEELVPRVVENVARPYCAFVEPTPLLAPSLDGACPPRKEEQDAETRPPRKEEQDAETRPPRKEEQDAAARTPALFAVVGNHDVRAADDGRLQRTAVPDLVANWQVPAVSSPVVRELPGGLSLVFVFSEWPWDPPQEAALAAALRSARGPWRVIVGHRPPIDGHPRFSQLVAAAGRASGHVIHAYLAGHLHVLGAIRGDTPGEPRLTVIAGSGAHAELQTSTEYRVEGADVLAESLGFARVDAFAATAPDGSDARLVVTLYRAPRFPLVSFLGPRPLARYAIHLDGRVERLDALEDPGGDSGEH